MTVLDLDPTEADVLDVLWLAERLDGSPARMAASPRGGRANSLDEPASSDAASSAAVTGDARRRAVAPLKPAETPRGSAARLYGQPASRSIPRHTSSAASVRVPAVEGIPRKFELARAMRPLKRTVPSQHEFILDENATADRIAEERHCVPALRSARRRWLELALLIDGHRSMALWRQLSDELSVLFGQVGAFRDIRVWTMDHPSDAPGRLGIRPYSSSGRTNVLRSPSELRDPRGERAILLFSDCTGPAWQVGAAHQALADWARYGPVAVLQPLPQRLWHHCAVRVASARFRPTGPGVPTSRMWWHRYGTVRQKSPDVIPVPLLELDADWLAAWSRLVAASGSTGEDGMAVLVGPGQGKALRAPPGADGLSARERVRQFRAGASAEAFDLARYLSAAPISLPIARLIQEAMMDRPRAAQVAEVFLGGLLRRVGPASNDPDEFQYDFLSGVRDELLSTVRASEALAVLHKVSEAIGIRVGQSRDFRALLAGASITGDHILTPDSRPFALVAEHVLRRLGDHYVTGADELRAAITAEQEPNVGDTPVATASLTKAPGPGGGGTVPAVPSGPGKVGPLLINIPQHPLVCPYCFESFRDRDILFRCSGRPPSARRAGCAAEPDEGLRSRTGFSGSLPPVFTADARRADAHCPRCGVETRHRVCPYCHSTLPAGFGRPKMRNRLIALVGARESGKTVYMTVLVHELRHGVGSVLNSGTRGADDTTRIRFKQEYEDPLYRDFQLPASTRPADQFGHAPLVFRFETEHRARWRLRKEETLLSFFDTAGEDFTSERGFEWMARYLTGADGVLLLIDPLQMSEARRQATPASRLPIIPPTGRGPVAVLDHVTSVLLAEDSPVEKPVAVAFTKMDTLWHQLSPTSPLRRPTPHTPTFDEEDSWDVHDQVRGLLYSWDVGEIDRTMEENYRRWRYFGVSALGGPPTADNRVPPHGPRPNRIADPFLWLLNVFGTIPSGKG
ncbi:GTPase domain-containing protein [Actinomadura sp. HBU206391]|uniref:GTPase domain-containing protein n=1 Tax=Actinomadura sp. HBU206391 TaxID=2731692 RepID=UPI0021C9B972|nr:GTPase domain-containing protein [Actinomadura sp. HBU206391]